MQVVVAAAIEVVRVVVYNVPALLLALECPVESTHHAPVEVTPDTAHAAPADGRPAALAQRVLARVRPPSRPPKPPLSVSNSVSSVVAHVPAVKAPTVAPESPV